MSAAALQPYLFFGGRADEAIAFYRTALGAELEMRMSFREAPDPPPPGAIAPGWDDKVMHASLRIHGAVLMVSDAMGPGGKFEGFSLSLTLSDAAAVDAAFAALADGGTVTMPPGKTFWAERFGMLTDRFGVGWMLGV
jgi:PhnB protein